MLIPKRGSSTSELQNLGPYTYSHLWIMLAHLLYRWEVQFIPTRDCYRESEMFSEHLCEMVLLFKIEEQRTTLMHMSQVTLVLVK